MSEPLDRDAARLGSAGAALGFIAVALGAFGAHTLRARIDPGQLAVFETGVRYHLVHALAILAACWTLDRTGRRSARLAGWLFVAGIVLFSGSLYAMSLGGAPVLGIITPFGGVSLLAGWVALAASFARA